MSWLTDLIIATIVLVARHPFFMLAILILTPLVAALILPVALRPPLTRRVRLLMLLAILVVPANFTVGDAVANTLIYAGGVDGHAIQTWRHTLNETYNNHNVVSWGLTIQTMDGRTIETSTKSDDFNIYRGKQAIASDTGQFQIRYLRHFPTILIFMAD